MLLKYKNFHLVIKSFFKKNYKEKRCERNELPVSGYEDSLFFVGGNRFSGEKRQIQERMIRTRFSW